MPLIYKGGIAQRLTVGLTNRNSKQVLNQQYKDDSFFVDKTYICPHFRTKQPLCAWLLGQKNCIRNF